MKDKNIAEEDRLSIEEALANHGDKARELRNLMKDALKLLGNNLKSLTAEEKVKFSKSVDNMPNTVDEDQIENPEDLSTTVQMGCEDYGGNFVLPSFGNVRPGSDYYASKLSINVFVISDVSRGSNKVFIYDQRCAGKGADAVCSMRLLHHLSNQNKLCDALTHDENTPIPTNLFQVMDNNVGQNKSQTVFMFSALLSLTLFPLGVTLLFLAPGHSHFFPDKVTGWLRNIIKGCQIYSPEKLADLFGTVKNVEVTFLDHRKPDCPMSAGWDRLLHDHFTVIPDLKKIGCYTSCQLFVFEKGTLTIRKTPSSEVCYTHQYIQVPNRATNASDVANCLSSLQQKLFTNNKTFDDATIKDVRLQVHGDENDENRPFLFRQPLLDMPLKQIESFWSKGHAIPTEFLSYYPTRPGGFDPEKEDDNIDIEGIAVKPGEKRKMLQPSIIKTIKKDKKAGKNPTPVNTSNLLNFFFKPSTVPIINTVPKQNKLVKRKTWHESEDVPTDIIATISSTFESSQVN